jgi:hypothetical protein
MIRAEMNLLIIKSFERFPVICIKSSVENNQHPTERMELTAALVFFSFALQHFVFFCIERKCQN